jgi:hypothetical protein
MKITFFQLFFLTFFLIFLTLNDGATFDKKSDETIRKKVKNWDIFRIFRDFSGFFWIFLIFFGPIGQLLDKFKDFLDNGG